MVATLEYIVEQSLRVPSDWLICDSDNLFPLIIKQRYLELMQFSHWKTPPKILLAEPEPVKFLASFLAACQANCPVFLCNPGWGQQEWEQVFDLVKPDIIWGVNHKVSELCKEQHSFPPSPCPSLSPSPLIMIPTGGSSGKIKFAMHTWETLMASVRGFKEYFQVDNINSFCVLPIYHVGGLMQFMRSFTTGGQLAILPFKELESGQNYNIQPQEFFISLVPTQLQRLLQNAELTQWLAQFQTVLLGGAPAWSELLEAARCHKIRLGLTYGMTETASQIATLLPDDFLKGKDSCTRLLPHAKVNIYNEKGEILKPNQTGNIKISSQSLALGYYPNIQTNWEFLQTDDLGFLDEQGYLHISGRSSDKIITGGENVYAIEVESAIRGTQMVTDVCAIGVPDPVWGQAITAIYIPKNSNISYLQIKELLKNKMSRFKIPKNWIKVDSLPRNSQGKINRLQVQELASNFLQKNLRQNQVLTPPKHTNQHSGCDRATG
ncbi:MULTISPECIES: 2-succinylbenzoate--CoA ligase [Nostocales]|uniref:2-succinylbenzoate--CoA ligase n=3 Tax=Nostocales TaxID=1161 RepID=A0A8S9T1Z4_9CYAN|nr:2-succinylbenzoate--CoA ligase [Tolypothrix bouteillei]KAF3886007.1 2-succinylbenzoate--CoA ligase [Tolypothrix bouteillei VB521301]